MKLALLAVAAALVAAPAAFAQDSAPAGGPSPAMREAMTKVREQCATDMQTYCASATDRQSRMQCMRENADKLSQGCRQALSANRAQRQ